jgi:pimeloyl-ACP methyl ester carboxylesterase
MYLNTQEGAADLYRHDDCRFLIETMMPSHPDPEEVRSRLRDPDAMRAMLNWDRGNPLADLFLANLSGELAYEKCTVPTLGIWSSGDDYLLEEHMQDSAEFTAADWRYARIEDASHWPMLDRPDEVTTLVRDWLAADVKAASTAL